MTNITTNIDQIMNFARSYGLPALKKRAIIREYLQSKIISIIYTQKISKQLFFVGGTALRLLHGLDRFSEDLDFDAPDVSKSEIKNLLDEVSLILAKENIAVELYQNPKGKKDYYELRFSKILYEAGVTPNKDEKLAIKFDFESFWKGQERETILFNRYGFLANVVTKTLDQFIVEKIVAYLNRPKTAPRDIYDLVWLKSHGAKPDANFAKYNKFDLKKITEQSLKKFSKEKTTLIKGSLIPFLLDETSVNKIDFFNPLFTIDPD